MSPSRAESFNLLSWFHILPFLPGFPSFLPLVYTPLHKPYKYVWLLDSLCGVSRANCCYVVYFCRIAHMNGLFWFYYLPLVHCVKSYSCDLDHGSDVLSTVLLLISPYPPKCQENLRSLLGKYPKTEKFSLILSIGKCLMYNTKH